MRAAPTTHSLSPSENRLPTGSSLDPATGAVSYGPPLTTTQGVVTLAVLDGRIHALGGMIIWPPMDEWDDAHEVFDPATGAWTALARPPFSPGYAAAALDGRVYAISRGPSGALYVYDPAADSWTTRFAPRGRWGSVAVEGPAIRARVRDEAGTTREVAIHEFPEDIARELLRPFALHSSALTG